MKVDSGCEGCRFLWFDPDELKGSPYRCGLRKGQECPREGAFYTPVRSGRGLFHGLQVELLKLQERVLEIVARERGKSW